jgi:GT2 family glycosyltransferase
MSPISVVIPTYGRHLQLGAAIKRMLECTPPPAEIIVHIDAGDFVTEAWLRSAFPGVRVLRSDNRMGPGGGRNKLVAAACHDIVASFDDDSYPLDRDYFARLCEVFSRRPDAAVVASQITHRGEPVPDAKAAICPAVQFVGCGVAYRRTDFLECEGYLPIAIAYGMEEVDLGIRLTSRSKNIYFTPWLRVFHDTDLSHHASADITAASIANLALLTYLRYPPRYWPYGGMQVLNRVLWLVKTGRLQGIVLGLLAIPGHLWRHKELRDPVSPAQLSAFLLARRSSVPSEPLALDA